MGVGWARAGLILNAEATIIGLIQAGFEAAFETEIGLGCLGVDEAAPIGYVAGCVNAVVIASVGGVGSDRVGS